jgi:hypothetical protein
MQQKFACPSCGGEIVFKTSIAAYAVCPYCNTMTVRNNDAIENLGIMAALPPDTSPFQLGAEAFFGRTRFTIVGRMKISWGDGMWNEWFFVDDAGRKGWLAEAQGSYAVTYDLSDELSENEVRQIRGTDYRARKRTLLDKYRFRQNDYFISDVKEAECVGAEGELPYTTPVGRKSLCVDLVGEDEDFASLDITDKEVRVYIGRTVSWADLRCSGYRTFEGW